jgi:hypothetical protein
VAVVSSRITGSRFAAMTIGRSSRGTGLSVLAAFGSVAGVGTSVMNMVYPIRFGFRWRASSV